MFAAAVTEHVLTGGRILRNAFSQTPVHNVPRDAKLASLSDLDPSVILIRNGFAFRSCAMADGKRGILHIFAPMDVAGLDHVVLSNSTEEIVAAGQVSFQALPVLRVRELIATDQNVAVYVMARLSEMRLRSDRLAASIGRLDAQARICVLLLDMHDRLHRNNLISRGTYNLPLTQEQIADHLGLTVVHVNRTLRRLREARIVIVERQVVIIMDHDRLRSLAEGLPGTPELSSAAASTEAFESPVGATTQEKLSGVSV